MPPFTPINEKTVIGYVMVNNGFFSKAQLTILLL